MSCAYLKFGLIVTGKTEEAHLPKLFRSLTETGICHFEVIRRIGQRDQIISTGRKLNMVGSGKTIPNRDVSEIGIPARRYLTDNCHLVILIDDLEYARQEQAQQVFIRYRRAFDAILTDEQKNRASVHFLVTMLEAYYFADVEAINISLSLFSPLEESNTEDVEMIRNPKAEIKKLYPEFNEIKDGSNILERLDVKKVLSHPEMCVWLRSLFAWCVKSLRCYSLNEYDNLLLQLDDQYQIPNGELSPVTRAQ